MESVRKANKRKVFSDSDSEKVSTVSPPRKKRKHSKRDKVILQTSSQCSSSLPKQSDGAKHCFTIRFFFLFRRSRIWPFLTLRGPYVYFLPLLGNSSIKNRLYCNFIRKMLLKIHENTVKFRDIDIPKITQNYGESNGPGVDTVMEIAEKMCQKVFRVDNDKGLSFNLYEDGMIALLRDVFLKKTIIIRYDTNTEILDRLKSLCSTKNINVTTEELEDGRNVFVRYCFKLSMDFLQHTLFANVNKITGSVQIQAFRVSEVHSNHQLHTNSKWLSESARLNFISIAWLKRDKYGSSLWLSLPCEEIGHLLESVLEYGLIQLLPENVKTFLTTWILGVRKRMRKRLANGDLRKTMEIVMSESEKVVEMTLDDYRIQQFVVKILENVLNTKKFQIFEGRWREYTVDLIKTMKGPPFGKSPDCHKILRDVCEKMHPSSLLQLSSLFSGSPSDQSIRSHTLLQLLRFVVCLSLNTIRHVFHFNHDTFQITFDGTIEEEITNFEAFDQTAAVEAIPVFPASSYQSPTMERQIFRPRKTLLPTPCIAVPPASSLPTGFDQTIPPPPFRPSPAQFSFNHINSFPTPPSSLLFPNKIREGDGGIREKKSFFCSYNNKTPTIPFMNHEVENKLDHSNLSLEVTEEDLLSARALRTPSVVSGSQLNQLDDDEDVPKKWLNAYKLTLEWNQDLKSELERVKARLDKLS